MAEPAPGITRTCFLEGHHRLADVPVVRIHQTLSCTALKAFEAIGSGALLAARLCERTSIPTDNFNHSSCPDRLEGQLAACLARLSLSLQRAAGHEVRACGVLHQDERPFNCQYWVEYDHPDSGFESVQLASRLVAEGLNCSAEDFGEIGGWPEDGEAACRTFISRNGRLATPADTRAIMSAARARGIPVVRLDRPPCDPIEGSFRIRAHALLRLGQGRHQHTVDGTFCVSRSEPVFELVRNRRARLHRLAQLGVPLTAAGPGAQWCSGGVRAVRAWRRISGPVSIRPEHESTSSMPLVTLDDEDSIRAAADRALASRSDVLLEPADDSPTWLFPVSGGRVGALLGRVSGAKNLAPSDARMHPDWSSLAERVAGELDAGLMVFWLKADDPGQPSGSGRGAVLDVELAPRLDQWFESNDKELSRLAGRFVEWLYPDPTVARVPIAAITGTNGKTTTARMLSSILQAAGQTTAMACSNGTFIDGQRISRLEDGYLPGHLTALDHPRTELAVLEATRGGLLTTGLGFDRCQVAACLNVSEDHLNPEFGTSTVAQMAEVKAEIVDFADEAVVLNADDEHCHAMLEQFADRRIGLVSTQRPIGELSALTGGDASFSVVEANDGRDWIVLHEAGSATPVAAVEEIPSCHAGCALHNVSNAAHAALLAHLMRVPADTIGRALCALDSDFETHFGRLNRVAGLPFELYVDYAHNPEGMRYLKLFVDKMQPKGRKILNFSCSGANDDAFIRKLGQTAAGAFDHYVCKPFGELFGRQPDEVPKLLQEGLVAGGASERTVTLIDEEFESIRQTLAMAESGDFVVVIAGKRKDQIWELLTDFRDRIQSGHGPGQANNRQ